MNRRYALAAAGTSFVGRLGAGLTTGTLEITPGPKTKIDRAEQTGTITAKTVTVEEDPRVDEPAHEIERPDSPESPENSDEWNDEYPGEHRETGSSLA